LKYTGRFTSNLKNIFKLGSKTSLCAVFNTGFKVGRYAPADIQILTYIYKEKKNLGLQPMVVKHLKKSASGKSCRRFESKKKRGEINSITAEPKAIK
jgi:hypothetical protein